MSEDEKIVRQRYANVFLEQKGQKFRVIQRQAAGRPIGLTSLCKTEAGAWKAAARHCR
jgi:hypothetical protein